MSTLKRKALLLFKSEKSLGAKQIVSHYSTKTFDEMQNTTIDVSEVDLINIPDKVRIKDLSSHLNKVKKEFIGHSELSFYHATLIVLLRRGYNPKDTFSEFEKLWADKSDFLLSTLSLRWIISACDSFIDYSTDKIRAAIMMNAVTLINTLKVYETQRFLRGDKKDEAMIDDNLQALYLSDKTLYEGLTYFRVGTDDTLKHMRERYQKFYTDDWLATTILLHIFDKLQEIDSAFKTAKQLHIDNNCKWWSSVI